MSSTIHTARRLGIESDLPPVPSLALGTGEVTLLEMVSAYGARANEGVWTRPTLITRVEDATGAVLYAAPFDQRRAVSTGTAYLMNSMMSDVVNRGTGWRARQAGFTLPAAGKTGTSDDYADAWFVGYTPGVVAGVWFGHDRRKTIMKSYASDIAVPAWAAFMREATRGHTPVWYEMPSDVEKVEICRASGHRAGDACRRSPGYARVMLMDGSIVDREVQGGVATELFTLGSAPYGECPLHSGLYLDASWELAPMPDLSDLSDLSSDLSMPAMPRGMSEPLAPGLLTGDDLSSPLFKASEAVGTSGVTPAPRATSAPPTSLPPIPVSPSLPSATKPALGAIPKAGAPKLPGTPVRKPGGGIKIESVVKSDGTTVTVIRDNRGGG
jgi:membrane peptidoglycan carboxypeptidase